MVNRVEQVSDGEFDAAIFVAVAVVVVVVGFLGTIVHPAGCAQFATIKKR